MGLLPVVVWVAAVRGHRSAQRCRPKPRARMGIGYVPQGREIFPQLTVEENLRVGARHPQGRAAQHSRQDLRAVPGAEADAAPARRRPLRRAAAAAGHRARAGARAEAADPRRTDRRHPAEHRARDRRHHPEAESGDRRHRSCWSSRSCRSRGASPASSTSSRRGDASPAVRSTSSPTTSCANISACDNIGGVLEPAIDLSHGPHDGQLTPPGAALPWRSASRARGRHGPSRRHPRSIAGAWSRAPSRRAHCGC